jgi:UDP-N-acetylglucosamine/UDP-N-acetylgalactosamine diphosphorylase
MDAIRDTVNSALEKLNMGGAAPQGTPAKEPSEEELNELKSKYSKAGQEQVFVRTA